MARRIPRRQRLLHQPVRLPARAYRRGLPRTLACAASEGDRHGGGRRERGRLPATRRAYAREGDRGRARDLARMGARLALLERHDAAISQLVSEEGRKMARNKIIGLLIGRENTFPGPFIEVVNKKGKADGITAELAVLGGTSELAEQHHAVLVDRISHEVPYYRAHLKSAVLMGTTVINDPFCWEADAQ